MSAGSPDPFPWDEVLHVALGVLRWSPAETWQATPREIAAALGSGSAESRPVMGRGEFLDLMRTFPDKT